jgi:predicted small lipoprotein YifL
MRQTERSEQKTLQKVPSRIPSTSTFHMMSRSRAGALLAILPFLVACGQKGPLYLEREAPPEVATDDSDKPRKPVKTTVEPTSRENTATELPPVIE